MDYAFGAAHTQDFHEKHAERIVSESNVPAILQKYGYDTKRILNHHNFSILEQDLPALCADRVDYALKTFHTSFNTPVSELQKYLGDLVIADKKIVFRDPVLAKEFAELFMKGDLEVWGGSYFTNAVYQLFAEIVKSDYERGNITLDDFFTTDKQLMEKLSPEANEELEKLRRLEFREASAGQPHDLYIKSKIRFVDPPVLTDGKLPKLSEIDQEFASHLAQFLARRKLGNYVKIIS